jgi:hypothetical protein
MRKLLVALTIACLLPFSAMADCDFKTGITKNENGTYTYTRECHIKVGELRQDLDIANEQNLKFTKALELKDLAINKADQRADMWQQTAFKLEDRITTIDNMRTSNQWIMFGVGVATMFAASYAASQLSHR